jgi:hypothetical protein
MTRDELIDAGYAAMDEAERNGLAAPLLGAVLDVWEPLIRADERNRIRARTSDALSGLRAQVEALPPGVRWDPHQDGNPDVVLRVDVLALIDEGTDE